MGKKKDILFLGLHRPNRSPSQRYRIEQFLPFLREKGVSFDYEFLLNEQRDKKFYASGAYFYKATIVIYSIFKLILISFFKSKNYHSVFIQREAFMLGTAFFEKIIAKHSRLIFDFDDSIWMANVSEANKRLAFLKNPDKTSEIISISDEIIVGNSFLKDYALNYSKNVQVIPTCVCTNEYNRSSDYKEKESTRVCIGWSGSQTTIEHFKLALPVLKSIQAKYGDKVYFKVIGDASFNNDELGINGIQWKKDTEIWELEEIDIGIMPLPNDEWSKGKCGLKGLVYMSMKIPAILENVGVNAEIIEEGQNGMLCDSPESWIEKLSLLIENPKLRKAMGEKGRVTILENYSVKANRKSFLKTILHE